MKLIIAEKPSVAMEIAKVIGATDKKNSYISGNEYIVSWCFGHLVGLAQPQEYDEKYKKWTLEDLPIIPKNYKLVVNDETKDHFYMLKNLMNREDIEEIICATDSGREGELIFRFVYEKANCKKPFKRLWISSLTEESIRNGFRNLQNGRTFDNLYQAGLQRVMADWIVGMNASRLYSITYGNKITVGRVQTPTLNILVEREHKIKNFKKEKNYKILLEKDDFRAESKVFTSEKEVKETFEKIQNKKIICTSAEKTEFIKRPPKLYDLTTLQREANQILNLTAQETLNIAQSLYEKKLLTYPRTDSSYISDDMQEETIEIVNSLYGKYDFLEDIESICNIEQVVNNSKITDHHAIIPTNQFLVSDLSKLSENERNVLLMVCSKLLQALHKKVNGYTYSYSFTVEDVVFASKYDCIYEKGFLDIQNIFLEKIQDKKIEQVQQQYTQQIQKGEEIKDFLLRTYDYFTTPPKRYTEDTLLSAMENVEKGKIDEDFEKKGLGTPATRSGIIEKLISVGYVERQGKNLVPTEKGISAIEIVDEKLKSHILTTELEIKLQDIEKGNFSSEIFRESIEEFTKQVVSEKVVNKDVRSRLEHMNNVVKNSIRENLGKCPICSKNVYESEKVFRCEDKDCRFVLFKSDKFFLTKKAKLTKTKVKEMLNKGQAKFKFFSEKAGKEYDAFVSLEITENYINYKIKFQKG